MNEVYICDALRTPIGRVRGSLAGIDIEDLLSPLISSLLKRAGLPVASVNEVIVGNAAGPGGNPARVALLTAGLPITVPGLTIDRQCGSGLEAINLGARLIQSGAASVVLAGGAESPSTAPLRARNHNRDSPPEFYQRARFSPDTIGDPDMGLAAENVAEAYGITRQRQDEFALHSHQKTQVAIKDGRFAAELVPIKNNEELIGVDECPRPDVTLTALAALRPVFTAAGSVTAGNACPINDGAAMVLMMSRLRWNELNRPEEASGRGQSKSTILRFVDSAVEGVDPNLLGIGPVPAVRALLSKHQLDVASIDQIEFNEAFAAQVLASVDQLGIDQSRLNPGGGALALGHPYGASGAILVTRLLHDLNVGQMGLATLGIGGGMGIATLFERIDPTSDHR